MEDWWSDIDNDVLDALAHGATAPAEIARRLEISEESAASLLWSLANQGKVRIREVELV